MLRAATHADTARLMQIRASVRENRLADPTRVTPADYRWFIDHAVIHVWEAGDHIHGFSAADPRDGSIWALFVDGACEGRGIGQRLIEAACASLREAGHQVATLGTEPETRAERFYRRNGWIAEGVTSRGELWFTKAL
jgi:GNAT superfamily N-acetyltransferase